MAKPYLWLPAGQAESRFRRWIGGGDTTMVSVDDAFLLSLSRLDGAGFPGEARP